MAKELKGISILIDKLTNSIENSISGDIFKTEILTLQKSDLKNIINQDWAFNWKQEWEDTQKQVFKLVIKGSSKIIQGLISIEDKKDHIFMHLIESAKLNRGNKKIYIGVPGNLVAFACKIAFEKGYEGFVSFESKTRLINHYKKSLGAFVISGKLMAIETYASLKLVEKYFPNN